MEPRDAVENVTPAAPDSADAIEARRAKPAAAPLDPLERLGLVFFALTLVGLFLITPVVLDILRAPARATPIYEVSAVDLDAAYETDARAAQARYGGKQVIVAGAVDSFGSDTDGAPTVAFAAGEARVVRCVFGKDEPGVLVGLQKGKKVTVHGTCEGRGPSGDLVIRATNLQ